MIIRVFISVTSLVMITGCASLKLSDHMFSEAPTREEQIVVRMKAIERSDVVRKSLERDFTIDRVLQEFETYRNNGGNIPKGLGKRIFPAPVLGSDATYKMLKAISLRMDDPATSPSLVLTKTDMKGLSNDIISTIDLLRGLDAQALEADFGFLERLSSYLRAYYKGKFADRQGNRIGKPKISNNISTDTISGFVLVFWEGLLDTVFAEMGGYAPPVIFEKETIPAKYVEAPIQDPDNPDLYMMRYKLIEPAKVLPKYMTVDNNVPTVVTFDKSVSEEIEQGGTKWGITKKELELLNKGAGIAGDRAKLGTGFVVRTLGDIQLAFVYGGHFSFGDNDTFSKVVETTLEVWARRYAELIGYVAARHVDLR